MKKIFRATAATNILQSITSGDGLASHMYSIENDIFVVNVIFSLDTVAALCIDPVFSAARKAQPNETCT